MEVLLSYFILSWTCTRKNKGTQERCPPFGSSTVFKHAKPAITRLKNKTSI